MSKRSFFAERKRRNTHPPCADYSQLLIATETVGDPEIQASTIKCGTCERTFHP